MNIYVVTHPMQEVHSPICRDLRGSAGETSRTTHHQTLAEVLAATPGAKVMPCIKEGK